MELTQTWYATAAAAWGCYLFGVACFRMANGDKLFLGVAKAALVTCPVVLSCFGIHATRQYQVILATTRIPVIEVANSDNGRERTIQRINCPDGVLFERVLAAGWSATGGAYRHRQSASGEVLRGVDAGTRGSAKIPTGTEGTGGGNCRCLAVPGCCNGRCPDCICNQLEITGNGRQF